MVAMTTVAARSERITTCQSLAMERFGMLLLLFGVAGAAIHFGRRGMRNVLALQISVATRARECRVDGTCEAFAIHEKGYGLLAVFGRKGLIAVARQAGITVSRSC